MQPRSHEITQDEYMRKMLELHASIIKMEEYAKTLSFEGVRNKALILKSAATDAKHYFYDFMSKPHDYQRNNFHEFQNQLSAIFQKPEITELAAKRVTLRAVLKGIFLAIVGVVIVLSGLGAVQLVQEASRAHEKKKRKDGVGYTKEDVVGMFFKKKTTSQEKVEGVQKALEAFNEEPNKPLSKYSKLDDVFNQKPNLCKA